LKLPVGAKSAFLITADFLKILYRRGDWKEGSYEYRKKETGAFDSGG
jgi:hypothetical protein